MHAARGTGQPEGDARVPRALEPEDQRAQAGRVDEGQVGQVHHDRPGLAGDRVGQRHPHLVDGQHVDLAVQRHGHRVGVTVQAGYQFLGMRSLPS